MWSAEYRLLLSHYLSTVLSVESRRRTGAWASKLGYIGFSMSSRTDLR